MKNKIIFFLLISMLCVHAALKASDNQREKNTEIIIKNDLKSDPKNKKEEEEGHKNQARVTKIVDGDTIEVFFQNSFQRVRLLSIDTPETKRIPRARMMSIREKKDLEFLVFMGKKAKNFVASIVSPGNHVYLEFDLQTHDKYGRLLAYIYLEDGRMLNEIIAKEGYAYPLSIAPNYRYTDKILNAVQEAREKKIGLFAD